jgi:hypothetical protein
VSRLRLAKTRNEITSVAANGVDVVAVILGAAAVAIVLGLAAQRTSTRDPRISVTTQPAGASVAGATSRSRAQRRGAVGAAQTAMCVVLVPAAATTRDYS